MRWVGTWWHVAHLWAAVGHAACWTLRAGTRTRAGRARARGRVASTAASRCPVPVASDESDTDTPRHWWSKLQARTRTRIEHEDQDCEDWWTAGDRVTVPVAQLTHAPTGHREGRRRGGRG